MTNNNLDPNLIKAIDDRVQGRDIEKAFDYFIETVTDTLIDELGIEIDYEEGDFAAHDYIIEAVMSRFNYKLSID